MKKMVFAAGCILALGAFWLAGPLSGQTPTQTQPNQPAAAAPARTRIAVLNLTYVIKNYVKYQHFQEEIKGIVDPAQRKDGELRQQLENLRKQAEEMARQPASPKREEIDKQAKDLQRQLEDNAAEIKLKLGKRMDDEMKTLFMDVYDAAQRYARSHDFEMVLHFNDAVTQDDFLSSQNISRKLNTGALMPLWWQPSMDISKAVVDMLNYNLSTTATPGAAQGAQPNH